MDDAIDDFVFWPIKMSMPYYSNLCLFIRRYGAFKRFCRWFCVKFSLRCFNILLITEDLLVVNLQMTWRDSSV